MSSENNVTIDLKNTDHIKSFGHSMYPILHNEDVVYYKKTPYSKIKLNDIIVSGGNNHYVTHRVIYKTREYVITKGDNNRKIDGRIYPDAIIGVVNKVKRGEKTFHPETYYLLQSSIYFQHIAAVIKEMERHNITYVLLKGLPLHLKYNQEHPRRGFFDFDILISPKDRDVLMEKIADLGFKRRYDFLSPSHEKLMDKMIEETCIKKFEGFNIAVDVHYEAVFMMTQIGQLNPLYHQKYINQFTKDLFENTVIFHEHNLKCNLLTDEYLLVYLSLHFFHHSFKSLHRLNLIAAVIRSIPQNKENQFWKSVSGIIQKYKLQGYIYGTFMSMEKYLEEISVPEWFLDSISPSKSQYDYLKGYFKTEHIYEEYGPTRSGIQLFRNIYALSYNPWYIKIFTLLQPAVVFMILWLVYYFLTTRSKKLFRKFL